MTTPLVTAADPSSTPLSPKPNGSPACRSMMPLQAQVRLADLGSGQVGESWVEFVAVGLSSETAAVMFELYRRGGGWKVRAVGQGLSRRAGGAGS